jgi:hypothetical protein
MMVVILTLVWGGFAASVVAAMIHERRKTGPAGEANAGPETAAAEPGARNRGGK